MTRLRLLLLVLLSALTMPTHALVQADLSKPVSNVRELVAEAKAKPGTRLGWSGFVLPAGTPRAIVDKVSADTQAVPREPQMRERIAMVRLD